MFDSILVTLVIDALEGGDVAIADVSGAYLHTEILKDKRVILHLRGQFVDIICEVNPDFKDHIEYKEKQKKKVLHLRVIDALY